MNRRKFLSFIAGAIASGMAESSNIKSSIGARLTGYLLHGEGGISAKDYITDGLFAMWDGIENIGYGKHSYDTSVWYDLVSGYNAIIKDGVPWGWTDNSFSSDNETQYQVVAEAEGADSPVCTEICFNEFRRTSTHPFIVRTQGVKCLAVGTNTCIGGGFPLFSSIDIGFHTASVEWSPTAVFDNGTKVSQTSGSDTWYIQDGKIL